jgi:hypothetical protein
MGGYGSTRWGSHSKRDTVEDGLVLSMSDTLKRALALAPGTAGNLRWSRNGEAFASITFKRLDENGVRFLCLKYSKGSGDEKKELDYLVEIETVSPHFGGRRFYFLCPLVVNGKACLRRGDKLYLPPGQLYFGCRECYHLTYTSCQESHRFDGLFKHMAADMGGQFTARDIEKTLRSIK